MALLASSALALACGLMAAGPWNLSPLAGMESARDRAWGMNDLLHALACLPLALAAAWGAHGLHRAKHWPAAVRRPLSGFFGMSMAWSLLSIGHHLAPSRTGTVALLVVLAASCLLLLQGFMAERFGLVFGSRRACALAVGAAACAGAVCWLSGGDLRALAWLQMLPVVVLVTGVVAQPGLFTRGGDWVAMLAAYGLARAAEGLDAEFLRLSAGLLSGTMVMHLGAGAVATTLAYRVGRASRVGVGSVPLSMSSQRVTSLHMAG